jgi:hypothetical protein
MLGQRVIRCGEEHVVAVNAEHRGQLEPFRGDFASADGQVPGPVLVGVRDDRPGTGARRGSGNQLHPSFVVGLGQGFCMPGRRVDCQETDAPLVA